MDILEAIDRATGCQQCGNPLGPSPSDDFCGEGCQHAWHMKRTGARTDPLSIPHFTHDGRTITMGSDAELYQLDGERGWVRMGNLRGPVKVQVHYEIQANGRVVDNSEILRALHERQRNANMDLRGWIAPEVWDYIREDS